MRKAVSVTGEYISVITNKVCHSSISDVSRPSIKVNSYKRIWRGCSCERKVPPPPHDTVLTPFSAADHSSSMLSLMHKTNIAALVLTPLALLTPDNGTSTIAMVFNVAVGLSFPIHAHIGMSGVLTDYVPKLSKSALGPARFALVAITGVTVVGLLKHNLAGDGIAKSLKSLWCKPDEKTEKK